MVESNGTIFCPQCGSYNIQYDFGVLICQDCQWTWEPDEEEQTIININDIIYE